MRNLSMRIFIGSTTLIFFSTVLFAAPDFIKFQGRLTDSQGRPITGTPQVSFELYDAASGGIRLWGPTGFQNVNANEMGLFATDIGPFSSSSIFSGGKNLFLQVTIKAGTAQLNQVLSPRQHLSNVPYSFHAGEADKADTADRAESVADGSISEKKIQPDAIHSGHIADHSVDQVDLSTNITTQFLPSGLVAMFTRACPAGWTRFDLLDDKLATGAATYTGNSTGSWVVDGLSTNETGDHTHSSPSHSHGAGSLATDPLVRHGGYRADGCCLDVVQNTAINGKTGEASIRIETSGNHTHTIRSEGSWRPPTLALVFCEKD